MNLAVFVLGVTELVIITLVLAAFAFWLWMLVDCAKNEEDKTQKIVWVIIIVATGIFGAPLYFFIRKLPRKSQSK